MYLTATRLFFRLRRNLRLPQEVLKQRQWEALRRMVQYAWHHVPFYRRLYAQAGFSPDQLRSPDDLRRIPSTRKSLFQEANPSDLIGSGFALDRLVRKRTSGSSGSPLNVYYTPEDRIYRTLLHLRILFHNGMKLRDRVAHISDSRHAADYRYAFQKLGFLPKEFFCAADPPEAQLRALAEYRPDVIYSYASSMALLADEVVRLPLDSLRPRLIFTTGELLHPDDRRRIDEAFHVRLRDIYGIVEMGDVAWQCPEVSGYHLNADSFWAEIEAEGGRPASPGEPGKLIITNLHSFAMPFIRYEVGDMLTAPEEGGTCPCGCVFPRLNVVAGRADDWLHAPGGRRVSPLIFVVASVPGVRQYRMLQTAPDRLEVQILPGAGFSDQTLLQVGDHVREVMGHDVHVEVRSVETIPCDPSGKLRRVISQIEAAS